MGFPGAAPLRLLPLLLALLDPGSTEDVKVVNALVGETIDLPLYYSGEATGYIWTKEKNRVAEWDEGLSVTYYDTLKGRCELDTSTGVLTIRNLKDDDSARYKGVALVNNVYSSSLYYLHIFPSLNNPAVTCNVTGGNYNIFCDHQPEPKTYMWRSKAGLVAGTDYILTNFNKTLTLTKAKVPLQSLECVVQNPVSEKSASVPEDCFRGLISKREKTHRTYELVAVPVIASIAIIFAGYLSSIGSERLKAPEGSRIYLEAPEGSRIYLEAPEGSHIQLRLKYTGEAAGYTWTKGNEKIAEWHSPGEVSYGDAWKGRCHLDTSTGVLTIRDPTVADSSRYKGEALTESGSKVTKIELRVHE